MLIAEEQRFLFYLCSVLIFWNSMVPMRQQSGFSLVELSIVLVILGLLVGGVLSGQALIRAAELRSISAEYNKYTTAVYTFRDKYFALPGDITNATAFWTAAGGNGTGIDVACRTAMSVATTTGTCNGNGDGIINQQPNIIEGYTFWNHLSRAGLIEGNFFYRSTTESTWLAGVDYPASKLGSNIGWLPCYTDRGNFGRGNRNMFILSRPPWSSGACGFGLSANLRADEAYSIDVKVDDGQASNGKLTATNSAGASTGCITGVFAVEPTTANYILNSTAKACHLYVHMD